VHCLIGFENSIVERVTELRQNRRGLISKNILIRYSNRSGRSNETTKITVGVIWQCTDIYWRRIRMSCTTDLIEENNEGSQRVIKYD